MEWDKYYEESDIIAFNEQAPYYAYLLEQLTPYITHGKTPDQRLSVALGGLHPKVTQPHHFSGLCEAVFAHPLDIHIIEQNQQVLDSLPEIDDQHLDHAQLENLPSSIPPLSLLICDFTMDFMTDAQIIQFNQSFPTKLDQYGLLIVAQDCPLIPLRAKIHNKLSYGIDYYPRSVKQLCKMLSNFKSIYQGITENNSHITIFTHKLSPLPEHTGDPFSPNPHSGEFAEWLKSHTK